MGLQFSAVRPLAVSLFLLALLFSACGGEDVAIQGAPRSFPGPPIKQGQTDCGPTIKPSGEDAYWVVVQRGDVSCGQARAVLTAFLRTGKKTATVRGWRCATIRRGELRDGHCGRPDPRRSPRLLVRAYA